MSDRQQESAGVSDGARPHMGQSQVTSQGARRGLVYNQWLGAVLQAMRGTKSCAHDAELGVMGEILPFLKL